MNQFNKKEFLFALGDDAGFRNEVKNLIDIDDIEADITQLKMEKKEQ